MLHDIRIALAVIATLTGWSVEDLRAALLPQAQWERYALRGLRALDAGTFRDEIADTVSSLTVSPWTMAVCALGRLEAWAAETDELPPTGIATLVFRGLDVELDENYSRAARALARHPDGQELVELLTDSATDWREVVSLATG